MRMRGILSLTLNMATLLTSASVGDLSKKVSFNLVDDGLEGDGIQKRVAILTSGGDSQGMNAALRAVVRLSLHKGIKPYLVEEGYNGLVEGGDNIKECNWGSVSYVMHKGGTVIGTARCGEFRSQEGRLRAAKNLVSVGINNLVVIGGDGSLTGANLFKEEWKELLDKLVTDGQITHKVSTSYPYLNIVGLVGSIDNDMCGTDMTIGTDSALHRIIEALDCISSTASSHQRTFILEIMGRNCGYLTVMAGIACGADWVLIPENPPKPGWEDAMCEKLETCRKQGRRLNFILVAEGAIDQERRKLTPEYVKETIDSRLNYDTRITVLGHVQRGGKPSAYDRILGTRMGAAAAISLSNAEGEVEPVMIAIQGNEITEAPLMECVKRTRNIDTALSKCQFDEVQKLRGPSFLRNVKILKKLESCSPEGESTPRYTFAVMNVGAPAGGTNSCTRSFVRLLLYSGHTVLGIQRGFDGLANNDVIELDWLEVSEWGSLGGSQLGTTRTQPTNNTLPLIASIIEKHGIQGLLVVGGFESFQSLLILEENRHKYPALCIPIIQVAATISNNVPGTEYSLGCDTALNVMVTACDVLKQSATACRKRLFVVESMGGYCGYLATMSALAGGADNAYIFEESVKLADLQRDAQHLVQKFKGGNFERGLIIRNENCSKNYTTDFITQMLAEEGKDYFIARSIVLGHLQQGDQPTPFDRILATKYAHHSVDWLLEQVANGNDAVCVLGLVGVEYVASPVTNLREKSDMKHRIPLKQWWRELRPLIRILSRHVDTEFTGETHREKPLRPTGTTSSDRRFWIPPLVMIGAIFAIFTLAKLSAK